MMNNNETWVGKYVKFIDDVSHKALPDYCPVADTFGVVFEVEGNEICVQWPHGTTSGDDMWWCFKTDVEIMPEANSENVLRYGLVITDDAFGKTITEFGQRNAIRIRLISYCDKLYYHKMIDGEVVDFKVVGKANA
nr:MAG TPA: hypothetical protein [Caudoviricetes sp.]